MPVSGLDDAWADLPWNSIVYGVAASEPRSR